MKGGMPVLRDTRVKRDDPVAEPSPAPQAKPKPNAVTVFGFDKNDVLFSTDCAGSVQWCDSDGRIVALLARIKPGIWGFSKRGDDDWEEVLRIYGNPDIA